MKPIIHRMGKYKMFKQARSHLTSSFSFLDTLDCYIGTQEWMIQEVEDFTNNEERLIAALVCQNIREPLTYEVHYLRILYVLSGEMELYIDNKKRTYVAGCLIMANEWTKMEYSQLSDEMEVVSFLFKKEYFDANLLSALMKDSLMTRFFIDSIKATSRKSSYFVYQFEPNQDVHFLALLLLKQVVKMEYKHNEITKSAFLLFITEIAMNSNQALSLEDSELTPDLLIHQIMVDIESEYKSITLSSLAQKYHFHPNYLSPFIKKETGRTFSYLVQQVKMKCATQYLVETEISVQQIAEEIGYTDKTYFFQLFKKEFGMTPKQYRNQHKIKQSL